MSRSTSLRRVAILIQSLDREQGMRLLNSLSPAEASQVLEQVGRLGSVSLEERRAVVDEFLRVCRTAAADPGPANESAGTPCRPAQQPQPQSKQQPFSDELLQSDPELLAEALQEERPQLIAAVVAQLNPAVAAELLGSLSSELRANVLGRIAHLQPIEEATLSVLQSRIVDKMRQRRQLHRRQDACCSTVRAILEAAPPEQQQEMVSQLQEQDQQLARHVSPTAAASPPVAAQPTRPATARVEFADLERLDDASLTVLLRQAPVATVRLALLDASPRFIKSAVRCHPPLGSSPHALGPVRLSEIEIAQREVARLAGQLADDGMLVVATASRLAAAA